MDWTVGAPLHNDGAVDHDDVKDTRLDTVALTKFIDECVEYFSFPRGVEVKAENARRFKMLFGICAQIIRYARGWKLLSESGLPIEARLLVRSALEYAGTAQYAYLRVDGLDRLFKAAQLNQVDLFIRLHKFTGLDDYQQMAADVDVPKAGKSLPSVDQIFATLDPEDVIFRQAYAVLSQATHVTPSSMSQHFVVTGEDRQTWELNHHSDVDRFRAQTTYTLALAVMSATWIMAHVLDDAAMLEKLDSTSEELRLPLRYDGDWPETIRAFPST